ncbi:transferrin-binding protein-like solute binding protein [Edwardsiella piscicida]|nr:transferrin-binding protein-like solute binding protein [Edwardsiella piscicida]ELM3729466.1 transferrin-binding protein-like solute binding protein [Edwardsiella piscicida]ELV7537036.1 transferrin-binding protein-like solute binding protein [Edwardsiella piscicida]
MKPRYSTLFLLLSSALLTACGGGGGGSGGGGSDAAQAQSIAPVAPASQSIAPMAPASQPIAPVAPASQPIAAAPEVPPAALPAAAFGEPGAVYRAQLREIGPHDTIKIYGFDALSPDSEFTVKVEGTDIAIEVTPLPQRHEKDSRTINDQTVLTLRDADGKLAGYYGHVHTYTHRETAQDEDDQDQTTSSLVYAVNASERHRPETQADYEGTLFYNHFDIQREAAIRLHYQDNKITGDIKGSGLARDIDYVIRDDGGNTVSEEGAFGARLHHVNAPRNAVNGHLIGGFYGKEGEVAAGEVKFIDDYSVERGGVFGAQRVKRD